MKKRTSAQALLDHYLTAPVERAGPPGAGRRLSPKEQAAERTNEAARRQIEAETEERAAKSRRLAAARLGKDAPGRDG
ncbi:hypothetical protein [Cereibacter johrii]|uniref:hypothetical protein n=1 Tax=Cereibacter johrii TaxID=445629 RepID=UPI003CE6E158